jgi:hypothetical protein
VRAEDWLLEKAIPEPNSGCWLWLGALFKKGYAKVGTGKRGKVDLAHRVSWRRFRGPIPKGLFILHACDTRCCINPDHLFIGTARDNTQDCLRKGRFGSNSEKVRGEMHPNVKLTADQVLKIRQEKGRAELVAEKYGVTRSQINSIWARRSWRHV